MSSPLAVLNRIALFALLTDENHQIRFSNKALRDICTFSDGDSFSPTSLPDCVQLVRTHGGEREHFTTALKVDDEARLIQWTPSAFPQGATLYIGKDVTSDRRSFSTLKEMARNAADMTQSKMRFLATMSHEMRTPLNGILGMNGLLLDTELDGNQRTYAEAVRQSATALLGLINDILDYSKIEAGHLELEGHWFDPGNLLQSVAELLAPRAAEKGLEVAAYVAPDVPPRLYGDEGRLRQVLLNLAGNGVKFTEKGGVSLELCMAHGDQPDMSRIRFDIRDTGIGISEDELTKIFEEFSQADSSRARNHEGTGLGLTIAQQIVNAMGGKIDVESQLGKGSSFGFAINMNASGEDTVDIPNFSSRTAIIATDQPFLKRILELQLQSVRVGTILNAKNSSEALHHLSIHPDAMLFCDLSIAACDGRQLASACPQAIVLLSPLARGRLDAFREAGFSGYLIKPIRQASLAERLGDQTHKNKTAKAESRFDRTDTTPPAQSTKRLRILLAEDNQINSVLAQAILKRAGFHVDVAANGREALDTFTLAPYDIVLMDMRMPEMDGLEATRRLRASGANVPIIALTANASSSDRDDCFNAGMNDFISKPFEPQDLTGTLEKWAGTEVSAGGNAAAS